MRRKIGFFSTFLFSFCIITAQAQSAYTTHIIAAGETLSALAKDYHTTVGDIMRLNGMNSKSQLNIGEQIKIPASTAAVSKPAAVKPVTSAPPAANSVARTHAVQPHESLYRISQAYNISVEKLIALNHLSNNNISVGQTLIVSEGTMPPAPEKIRTSTPADNKSVQPQTNTSQPPLQPAIKQDVTNNSNAVITPQPEAVQPASSKVPGNTIKPVDSNTKNSTSNDAQQTTFAITGSSASTGFFTNIYGKDVEGRFEQTKTGTSMTFKSASGWADKKYYVLMNDAPPGSVVKIKNGNNELFAKVLWNLGNMKENDGLDFRISTAAAAALSISEQRFMVTVTYYQ